MTRALARDLLLLVAGFLLGGWFGAAVAALGVVAIRRAPALAPWLPAALLGLAALATLVPDAPAEDSLRHTFADDRPLAAAAGLAAGILLLVALVDTAVTRAAASPGPTTAPAPSSRLVLARTSSRAHVQATAAAAVAATALRLVVGGPVLSEAESAAVAGLRSGDGFAPDVPPIAVGLDALVPVGATTLTAVAAGGLVVAVGRLTTRLTDARTGAVAAVAAAAVPLTWASPLAITFGLSALVAALAVLSRRDAGTAAALVAGVLLGVATLSRPELALVAVATLAWCAVRPRPLPAGQFVVAVAAAAATITPWLIHVEHRTGTPGLTASTGDAIRSIGELGGGAVPELLTVVTMGTASAALAIRHRWFARRLAQLLPLVAGAILALVLLGADPGVLALYPALPLAALALAGVVVRELDQRPSRR